MQLTKKLLIVAITLSFIILPLGQAAMARDVFQQPETVSSGYITADVFAVRPAGVASTILGSVTFILGSPFAALGGNLDHSYQELVVKPFNYTFKRPIGVF